MKFYEVQIDVPSPMRLSFLNWLYPHMEDMMMLPTFVDCQLVEVLEENTDSPYCRFQCRYFYETDAQLEEYLTQYASQLRGDLPDSFKEKLKFERRVGLWGPL